MILVRILLCVCWMHWGRCVSLLMPFHLRLFILSVLLDLQRLFPRRRLLVPVSQVPVVHCWVDIFIFIIIVGQFDLLR